MEYQLCVICIAYSLYSHQKKNRHDLYSKVYYYEYNIHPVHLRHLSIYRKYTQCIHTSLLLPILYTHSIPVCFLFFVLSNMGTLIRLSVCGVCAVCVLCVCCACLCVRLNGMLCVN